MATPAQSPADVARTFNVTPMTVRRWCAAHAAYLSPAANPGNMGTRKLTPRDVEVLAVVAELRSTGQSTAQINAHLADLHFPDVDDDAQPTAQATQTAQDARDAGMLVPLALFASERARWDEREREYQQRIEELQREIGRLEGAQRRPAWWRRLLGE